MPLLTTEALLATFRRNVAESNRIDVAVAWLGPSRALDFLIDKTKDGTLKTRVAVGLGGNATSPVALRSLQGGGADLRVGIHSTGIFHPKFYLFRGPQRNIVWIGSANLTLGGFANNFELIHEFTDDGTALRWYEGIWARLPNTADHDIGVYEANWVRPRPPRPIAPDPEVAPDDLAEVLRNAGGWTGYVDALRVSDAFWLNRPDGISVLAEEWSWVDTIAHGNSIAKRASWVQLSPDEKRILLGIDTINATGAWGLLGSMGGAARAVGSFYANEEIRSLIRKSLQPLFDASDQEQFRGAVAQTISTITDLHGFGPAIATRLITLARPDMAVSVNGGSAPILSQLAELPEGPNTLGNIENYPRLLYWIHSQPWYNTPEPEGIFDQTIWRMRAALVDSFVYRPV